MTNCIALIESVLYDLKQRPWVEYLALYVVLLKLDFYWIFSDCSFFVYLNDVIIWVFDDALRISVSSITNINKFVLTTTYVSIWHNWSWFLAILLGDRNIWLKSTNNHSIPEALLQRSLEEIWQNNFSPWRYLCENLSNKRSNLI